MCIPPMGFKSLQGVVCRDGPRIIGFSRCASTPLSGVPVAFPSRPSPGSRESGSFPRAPCPLRSVFAFLPAPPFRSALSCPGVSSLFAASLEASTFAGDPNRPLRSVHRLSQPPDGLLRFRLRGPVSSRSHVQGFRSGSWSRPAAAPTRRRPCLPVLGRARAHRLPGCHPHASGLRGLVPRGEAFVEAGGWPSPTSAPLFGVHLLQVPSTASRPATMTARGSTHDLPIGIFPLALPRGRWSRRGPSAFQRRVRRWLVSERTHLHEVSAFRRALRSWGAQVPPTRRSRDREGPFQGGWRATDFHRYPPRRSPQCRPGCQRRRLSPAVAPPRLVSVTLPQLTPPYLHKRLLRTSISDFN
jgi:hypothetical protein